MLITWPSANQVFIINTWPHSQQVSPCFPSHLFFFLCVCYFECGESPRTMLITSYIYISASSNQRMTQQCLKVIDIHKQSWNSHPPVHSQGGGGWQRDTSVILVILSPSLWVWGDWLGDMLKYWIVTRCVTEAFQYHLCSTYILYAEI